MAVLLLVKQISKATSLPIVASGGFATGQAWVRSPAAQSDDLGGRFSSARVRQRRLLRTTGALETMAPSAGQSVALIDNLPNAVDHIATILAEAQATFARLKGMTL